MSVIHPAKGTYTQLNINDLILLVNQNAGQDNAPKKKEEEKTSTYCATILTLI